MARVDFCVGRRLQCGRENRSPLIQPPASDGHLRLRGGSVDYDDRIRPQTPNSQIKKRIGLPAAAPARSLSDHRKWEAEKHPLLAADVSTSLSEPVYSGSVSHGKTKN